MNNVNKTLYIPLYGKSYVSRKGLFLSDKWSEEIWAAEGFPLRGKAKSKWLAYYMGIRAAVFDGWVKERLAELPCAAVIHIGCGMDSRERRVGDGYSAWYDVDFPEVIAERKRYFTETEKYKMISGDAREPRWLEEIPERCAIVIMEGVSMYLKGDELETLVKAISAKFDNFYLLMDCYSGFAAKMSKYKNPINEVGVTEVYGIDEPRIFESYADFIKEHDMTPERYINELRGSERFIFSRLYAGGFAKKLYRLYEYRKAR